MVAWVVARKSDGEVFGTLVAPANGATLFDQIDEICNPFACKVSKTKFGYDDAVWYEFDEDRYPVTGPIKLMEE